MLIALCVLAVPAIAQPTAPFETLTLRLSGTVEVPDTRYGAVWQPSPGVAFSTVLPFYLGLTLDAGLAFSIHNTDGQFNGSALPDFLAMHGYAGLGAGFQLPIGGRVHGGVHAGILSMDFYEDDAVTALARRESELATGLFAEGSAMVTERLGLFVGARWTHVYTSTPIDMLRVQTGVTWTIDTPRWLQEVLR